MKINYFIPLIVFVVMVGALMIGLRRDPQEIPSALINKPAPEFSLPSLTQKHIIMNDHMRGQVTLVNFFASWCVPCLAEHPIITEIAKDYNVVGINYKDKRETAIAWLKKHGNPYKWVAYDKHGRTGIDWGIYGLPETFVVDASGNIRYRHVGPITSDDWKNTLKPMLDSLR